MTALLAEWSKRGVFLLEGNAMRDQAYANLLREKVRHLEAKE
jgi:hypothetical protein